jgi:hypothetical protein
MRGKTQTQSLRYEGKSERELQGGMRGEGRLGLRYERKREREVGNEKGGREGGRKGADLNPD